MRLLNVLSSFSAEEFKKFGKFLASPYHNTNKNAVRLYEYIKPQHPAFNNIDLNSDKLFKKIFPGKKISPGSVRNISSEMIKLAESFLMHEALEKNELIKNRLLLGELKLKRLDKLFEKRMDESVDFLEKNYKRSNDYFYNKEMLDSLNLEYNELITLTGKGAAIYKVIPRITESIQHHFIIKILKEYFRQYNLKTRLGLEFESKMRPILMEYIGNNLADFEDIPVIKIIYKFLILAETKPNDELYAELKKLVLENDGSIEMDYYRVFLIELFNYVKDRLQETGNRKYGRESFEIMNEMLNRNAFLNEEKVLSSNMYINILSSAIREKEIDWAEKFADIYKDYIVPEHKTNSFNYGSALIECARGDEAANADKKRYYKNALEKLLKVKSEDFYFLTRIKHTSLKIYYELDELDNALAMTDAYNHFLKKNKLIPNKLKRRFSHFNTFFARLVKIKCGIRNSSIDILKRDIISADDVNYRSWLLTKACELEELID